MFGESSKPTASGHPRTQVCRATDYMQVSGPNEPKYESRVTSAVVYPWPTATVSSSFFPFVCLFDGHNVVGGALSGSVVCLVRVLLCSIVCATIGLWQCLIRFLPHGFIICFSRPTFRFTHTKVGVWVSEYYTLFALAEDRTPRRRVNPPTECKIRHIYRP